ncbi:hypothetical protein E2C01_030150 [Portunus trituberculatus]|uniref:Uncharacterized protein n=1 Tax=Portunus trituberculatus TaxID=210409 RepID=A0A5B7ERB5_PORTR|nr:hypothetical protein [Portunus trituberculatus]
MKECLAIEEQTWHDSRQKITSVILSEHRDGSLTRKQ